MKSPLFARFRSFGPLIALVLSLGIARVGLAQIYPPIDPIIGPETRITSPADHSIFHAPADIPIFAYVVRPYAATNHVEFYAGTNLLGEGFSLGATGRRPIWGFPVLPFPVLRLNSLYCFVWTNAPVGDYALRVTAPGISQFVIRTSPPVNISIVATAGTNGPNIASVVATDPIAIVGTNRWVWYGPPTNTTPGWSNWPPVRWQAYTNWGPKNATITVSRSGDATDAVTVNYSVGGTASNGVDYAGLPGNVTIPAGAAYALVPIVPIDHGPPYVPKTVLLKLSASTNAPPDYNVGIPSVAEALIVGQWPRPLPFLVPGGDFHANLSGPDGAWATVEGSSDMVNWTPLVTNQVLQGSIDYLDSTSGNPLRFYRAIPYNGPPPR